MAPNHQPLDLDNSMSLRPSQFSAPAELILIFLKGGRLRHVPATIRLAAAFRDHRHLRVPTCGAKDDGKPLTRQMV